MMEGYTIDGNGNHIHESAIVRPWVNLGNNNIIHAFCVLGAPTFTSGSRYCETYKETTLGEGGGIMIGDGNEFFEFTVVRRPSAKGKFTTIGHNNTISSHSTIFGGAQLGSNKCVTPHTNVRP